MEMVNITNDLNKNEEFLRNTIGQSPDTNYRRFNVTVFNNKTALLVNINSLVDVKLINDYILTPLMTFPAALRDPSSSADGPQINKRVFLHPSLQGWEIK